MGQSRNEALETLSKAIVVQIEASLKYNNPANLFKPAEGRYFRMFAAGKDVATGQVEVVSKTDSVTIEETKAREYSDDSESIDSDADFTITV